MLQGLKRVQYSLAMIGRLPGSTVLAQVLCRHLTGFVEPWTLGSRVAVDARTDRLLNQFALDAVDGLCHGKLRKGVKKERQPYTPQGCPIRKAQTRFSVGLCEGTRQAQHYTPQAWPVRKPQTAKPTHGVHQGVALV